MGNRSLFASAVVDIEGLDVQSSPCGLLWAYSPGSCTLPTRTCSPPPDRQQGLAKKDGMEKRPFQTSHRQIVIQCYINGAPLLFKRCKQKSEFVRCRGSHFQDEVIYVCGPVSVAAAESFASVSQPSFLPIAHSCCHAVSQLPSLLSLWMPHKYRTYTLYISFNLRSEVY